VPAAWGRDRWAFDIAPSDGTDVLEPVEGVWTVDVEHVECDPGDEAEVGCGS
jgi:hypothetical protein